MTSDVWDWDRATGLVGISHTGFFSGSDAVESFDNLPVSGQAPKGQARLAHYSKSLPHTHQHHTLMFNPPCKLEHLTELFQSLCDAAMDLDPQSLAGKIPENLLECAHLVVLADISVVRECASAAERLSKAEPYQIANLVAEHHQKITRYLFIRSMILDGDPADDPDGLDTEIF